MTSNEDAEIRNLLARYCLTLDMDDVDGWVELFSEDAVFTVYGRDFRGHDGLRRMATAAPGGLHLGGQAVIEQLDADHAHARHNLLFIERSAGGMRRAVYDHELVHTDQGWRIAALRCRFIVADGLADRPDD